MSAKLFVYGSLKNGFRHHAELLGAPFSGEARTIAGHTLVIVEGYPALIVSGSDHVIGEVYDLEEARFSALDAFEGKNYERAPIELEGLSEALQGRLSAEAYFLRRCHPARDVARRIGRTYRG